MAYRKISPPNEPTPTFAADDVADLEKILLDPSYDEQGTAAIVINTGDVYMLTSDRKWVKL